MRAGAAAAFAALILLAGSTSAAGAAEPTARPGDALAGAVPAGLDSLLTPEQRAGDEPGQWATPWIGPWGSNYLGPGGWRTYGPQYGPFGPYPTIQTAAFFGATNMSNPLTALALGLGGGGTGLGAVTTGPLASINQTGLAPFLQSIGNLQALGLATPGTGTAGQTTFTLGGQTFTLAPGQSIGGLTLGALLGLPSPIGGLSLGLGGPVGVVR